MLKEFTLDDVRAVLRTAEVGGLDMRLGDVPWALMRAVEEAVGQFGAVRTEHELVFPHDPGTLLADFLEGGPLPPAAPFAVGAPGCMTLPLDVAWPLVNGYSSVAEGSGDMRVLVAWAGSGAIVPALVDVNPTARITALEPDPGLAARLVGLPNVQVVAASLEDFLDTYEGPDFNAVAMNAPFLGEAARVRWAEAVFLGESVLGRGGRLMAVGPGDMGDRRYWRDAHVAELVRKNPGRVDDLVEMFGADAPSVVVTLDRPGLPWELRDRKAGQRGPAAAGPPRVAPGPAAAPTPVPRATGTRPQLQLDLFAPAAAERAAASSASLRPRAWRDVTDDELREVLAAATLRGVELKLAPRQLAQPVYEAFREMVRLLGGRWVSGTGVHRFVEDAAAALASFAAGGPRPVAARVGEGFVPTPAWLARQLVTHDLGLHAGSGALHVLEPSMGRGAIAEEVLACCPEARVTGVEPNAARVKLFAGDPRVEVVVSTFEAFAAGIVDARYDVVAMNPPFAVPGDSALWLKHLLIAWRLVVAGGLVACVAPLTFEHGRGPRFREVRELVAEVGTWRRLPEDAFAASGTMFPTGVLVLRKPLG